MRAAGQAFRAVKVRLCVVVLHQAQVSVRFALTESPRTRYWPAPTRSRWFDRRCAKCPDGGIGRRTVFRWRRSQGRGGSSPLLGTIYTAADVSRNDADRLQDKQAPAERGLAGLPLPLIGDGDDNGIAVGSSPCRLLRWYPSVEKYRLSEKQQTIQRASNGLAATGAIAKNN